MFAKQTHGRCIDCWRDRHPLATLEVMNRSVRNSALAMRGSREKYRYPVRQGPKASRSHVRARLVAFQRLALIFPDVFAMLLDEERVARGLCPAAHYDPLDFHETASKTLGFEDVYDALDSKGVSDA